MIRIEEIKEALSRMSECEIIHDPKDEKTNGLKFRKSGDIFAISSLPETKLSKTNIRLSRFIRVSKNTKINKAEGELIEASVNITGNTPCKAAYIYNVKELDMDSSFFITNLYTDKLDHFEKNNDEKKRILNIVVLILGMIVEVISCHQDILTQIDEAVRKREGEASGDGK